MTVASSTASTRQHLLLLFVVMLVVSTGSLELVSCFSSPTSTATSSQPKQPKRVILRGLDRSAFSHPLDQKLADITDQMLSLSIPFGPSTPALAKQLIRRGLSVAQQIVGLDLLSTSVKVSTKQLPHIYELLLEACEILDMSVVPDLFVQSNPQPNAYTLAVQTSSSSSSSSSDEQQQQRPIVVLTSALVDMCTPAELQAVIGHELGHLKCEHSVWLALGNVVAALSSTLPPPLRPQSSSSSSSSTSSWSTSSSSSTTTTATPMGIPSPDRLVSEWKLAAEYSCDRAALLVAQDVNVVNSAMVKLTSGTPTTTNVDAFVEQCYEYEKQLEQITSRSKDNGNGNNNNIINSWIQSYLKNSLEQRTHPLPIRRVVQLNDWSKSDTYARILSRGKRIAQEQQ